jgi:hypothetical protein
MNNVHSRPYKSRASDTAIVDSDTVERVAAHTVRWTSLGVLIVSYIGTTLALNGGVPELPISQLIKLWPWVSPLAAAGALVIQGLCTVLEWGYRKHRSDPRYFVPLLFDIGGTYMGYAPLLVALFAAGLARAGMAGALAGFLGHIGVVLLAVLAAYYPEQTLVDG